MVVITIPDVPAEELIKQMPSTKLVVNGHEVGTATLFITKHNVIWGGGVRAEGGPVPTISMMYQRISMHGVQRVPFPCLFMVLDFDLRSYMPELNLPQQQGAGADPEGGSDSDVDPDDYTQLRFFPPNEDELQNLYAAMSQGQSLNPDPVNDNQMEYEDYVDGEEFYDDEQYEDAEESEATPDDAANHQNGLNTADDAADHLNGLTIEQPNGNNHPAENGIEDPDHE